MSSPVRHLRRVLSPRTPPRLTLRVVTPQLLKRTRKVSRLSLSEDESKASCARRLFDKNIISNKYNVIPNLESFLPQLQVNSKVIPSVSSSEKVHFDGLNLSKYNILGQGGFGYVIISQYKGEWISLLLIN